MSLQSLKVQAYQLPASDRLELATAILQSLQVSPPIEPWEFLIARPHPWRRQLYIKGQKLLASVVWQDMLTNDLSPEAAAENWDLPLAAIAEISQYCQIHQDLLKLEAAEERSRLQSQGVALEPIAAA
jgi:hypothetical protein